MQIFNFIFVTLLFKTQANVLPATLNATKVNISTTEKFAELNKCPYFSAINFTTSCQNYNEKDAVVVDVEHVLQMFCALNYANLKSLCQKPQGKEHHIQHQSTVNLTLDAACNLIKHNSTIDQKSIKYLGDNCKVFCNSEGKLLDICEHAAYLISENVNDIQATKLQTNVDNNSKKIATDQVIIPKPQSSDAQPAEVVINTTTNKSTEKSTVDTKQKEIKTNDLPKAETVTSIAKNQAIVIPAETASSPIAETIRTPVTIPKSVDIKQQVDSTSPHTETVITNNKEIISKIQPDVSEFDDKIVQKTDVSTNPDVDESQEVQGEYDDEQSIDQPKLPEKTKPLNTNEDESPSSVANENSTEDDSYFFQYFMMVCIVFILGYVGYHNKQKILAIVLEGRKGKRQQRRRPNSANYHKLDSNLEEAVTSSCSKNATNVIY